jgi:hypothetical protein
VEVHNQHFVFEEQIFELVRPEALGEGLRRGNPLLYQNRNGRPAERIDVLLLGKPDPRKVATFHELVDPPVEALLRPAGENAQVLPAE